MRRFYKQVGWTKLRPSNFCFHADYIFNNSIYAPLVTADLDMETVVIFFGETYRPSNGGDALSLLKNTPYKLQWFDPRTGHFIQIEEHSNPVNGRLPLPAKPGNQDWLFLA